MEVMTQSHNGPMSVRMEGDIYDWAGMAKAERRERRISKMRVRRTTSSPSHNNQENNSPSFDWSKQRRDQLKKAKSEVFGKGRRKTTPAKDPTDLENDGFYDWSKKRQYLIKSKSLSCLNI